MVAVIHEHKNIKNVKFTEEDIGCIFSADRGRYLNTDIILLCMEYGYRDDYFQAIIDIFEDGDNDSESDNETYIVYNGVKYTNYRDFITDKYDYLDDIVWDCIEWLNENAINRPEDTVFDFNPDWGDFGLYRVEEDSDEYE